MTKKLRFCMEVAAAVNISRGFGINGQSCVTYETVAEVMAGLGTESHPIHREITAELNARLTKKPKHK